MVFETEKLNEVVSQLKSLKMDLDVVRKNLEDRAKLDPENNDKNDKNDDNKIEVG